MKKVLIISPHFPPVNSADMHRVRQTLPFLLSLGWEAEVIAVDPVYVEAYSLDHLLLKTIPNSVKVHHVKAWKASKTRKFGLGSLSIRSYFYFRKKGNEILKSGNFDLVYFSTTAFHVMKLGPYWKRKFKIPFVVDIQDPWRNDFYLDKPKSQRPPKFFLSYNVDKYLERSTIPNADGIIAVSQGYVDTFLKRYKNLKPTQFKVITFGGNSIDFEVMENYFQNQRIKFDKAKINVVYIGRGGYDMEFALDILFGGFNRGLEEIFNDFEKLRFWFIGTSYAPPGLGNKTIMPIAIKHGLENYVTELTDRLPYFESLYLLRQASILCIIGSTDTSYTASKIFPYILANKPLFGILFHKSSIVEILKKTEAGKAIAFDITRSPSDYYDECKMVLHHSIINREFDPNIDWKIFEPYSAFSMSKAQVDFFNEIVSSK